MPSQPDYERAARLRPDIFPPNVKTEIPKLMQMIDALAQKVAKYENKTIADVKDEARNSMGKNAPALNGLEREADKEGEKQPTEAKFFGAKKSLYYFPIERKETVPYKTMKPENVLYFQTEDEALAAGFTAGK